jgi:hypothetical protein
MSHNPATCSACRMYGAWPAGTGLGPLPEHVSVIGPIGSGKSGFKLCMNSFYGKEMPLDYLSRYPREYLPTTSATLLQMKGVTMPSVSGWPPPAPSAAMTPPKYTRYKVTVTIEEDSKEIVTATFGGSNENTVFNELRRYIEAYNG